MAVLPYATSASFRPSPLVRVGGLFGFVALAMVGLFLPLLTIDQPVFDFHGNPSERYILLVAHVVPVIQSLFVGVGIALVVLGPVMGPRRMYPGLLLALVLNLIALGAVAREIRSVLPEPPRPYVRWQTLSVEL